MKQEDGKRQAESRRIIEEVEREGDVFSSLTARSLGRARNHFTAGDADPADWTEVWGRRIGRALSLVALILLAFWLVSYFANR